MHEDGTHVRPEWYSNEFHGLRERGGLRRNNFEGLRNISVTLMLDQRHPVHIVAGWHEHDPAVSLSIYSEARRDSTPSLLWCAARPETPGPRRRFDADWAVTGGDRSDQVRIPAWIGPLAGGVTVRIGIADHICVIDSQTHVATLWAQIDGAPEDLAPAWAATPPPAHGIAVSGRAQAGVGSKSRTQTECLGAMQVARHVWR